MEVDTTTKTEKYKAAMDAMMKETARQHFFLGMMALAAECMLADWHNNVPVQESFAVAVMVDLLDQVSEYVLG